MSYYRINPPEHAALVRTLVAELAHPQPTQEAEPPLDAQSPTILEEASYLGRLGVTVVWDAWADVPAEVRGRIILDAYRQSFGEDVARNVGVALGLTKAQLDRMRAVESR